jgi:hypothetical protein
MPGDAVVLEIVPYKPFFKDNKVEFFLSPNELSGECLAYKTSVRANHRIFNIYKLNKTNVQKQ